MSFERLKAKPYEIAMGLSITGGAVVGGAGALAIIGSSHEEIRSERLATEVVEAYWTQGLEQASIDRAQYMSTLPATCDSALAPYYFDKPDGAKMSDAEVATIVQEECAIAPEQVEVARESLNNAMRLRTLITDARERKVSLGDESGYSFVDLGAFGGGIVLGAMGGAWMMNVASRIYSDIHNGVRRRRF